jgi:hypothetical protein
LAKNEDWNEIFHANGKEVQKKAEMAMLTLNKRSKAVETRKVII